MGGHLVYDICAMLIRSTVVVPCRIEVAPSEIEIGDELVGRARTPISHVTPNYGQTVTDESGKASFGHPSE